MKHVALVVLLAAGKANGQQNLCPLECEHGGNPDTETDDCTKCVDCDPGWIGTSCEIPEPCELDCLHGGIPDRETSDCTRCINCDPGWIGTSCEIPEKLTEECLGYLENEDRKKDFDKCVTRCNVEYSAIFQECYAHCEVTCYYTKAPTSEPTEAPTSQQPTPSPTYHPSVSSTEKPSKAPTIPATTNPTTNPTESRNDYILGMKPAAAAPVIAVVCLVGLFIVSASVIVVWKKCLASSRMKDAELHRPLYVNVSAKSCKSKNIARSARRPSRKKRNGDSRGSRTTTASKPPSECGSDVPYGSGVVGHRVSSGGSFVSDVPYNVGPQASLPPADASKDDASCTSSISNTSPRHYEQWEKPVGSASARKNRGSKRASKNERRPPSSQLSSLATLDAEAYEEELRAKDARIKQLTEKIVDLV